MTLAAVLGAALNPATSRSFGLYVAGLDLAASPTKGVPYGFELADLTVVEAGPGQVSKLTATIDDSALLVPLPQVDATIRLHDHVEGVPLFAGFVQSVDAEVLGVGRRIKLRAIGLEVLLDWLYVPALTIAGSTGLQGETIGAHLSKIVASSVGIGASPWTAWDDNPVTGDVCTPTTPIGLGVPGLLTITAWTWGGGTLRQAIASYLAHLVADLDPYGILRTYRWASTVDVNGGLRVFMVDNATGAAIRSDGRTIQLRTSGAFSRPANHRHGVRSTSAPRVAYVKGSGAGIAAVGDGSGIPGPTIAIADPNSTTAALAAGIGNAALGAPNRATGGSVEWEGASLVTTGGTRRAGDPVELLDPQVGIDVVATFAATQITKTWRGTEQTWAIEYAGGASAGSEAPAASQLIRKLTRDQLPRH